MKLLILLSLAFNLPALATSVEDVRKDILRVNQAPFIKKSQVNENTPSQNKWWEDRRALCLRDELETVEVERSLLRPWRQAWINQSADDFNKLTDKTFAAKDVFAAPTKARSERDGIVASSWDLAQLKTITEGLGQYSKIENVDLQMVDYTVDYDRRNEQFRYEEFEGTIKFDIRGYDAKNQRRTERGKWRAAFKKVDGQWKITAMKPLLGEVLVAQRAPSFVDESATQGLANLPVYMRTEAIRRGGYALAMADVNSDGINDMLVGFRDRSALLLGQKEGGFKDATQASGLGGVKFAKTAIFADLRNKGIQDLVMITLLPGQRANFAGAKSVLVFRGDGKGHFKAAPQALKDKASHLQPMPAAIADFDGDGFLDLYVGYPGIRDFTVFASRKENREMQGLYLNDGSGNFRDFSDQFKTADHGQPTKLYPHSSMAVDLDHKNGVDLIVVDDRNNLSPIYMNRGKGNFAQMAEPIGLGNRGFGMSVGAADFNNDGVTDIALSNVNFTAAHRAARACERHWDMKPIAFDENGLRLFKGGKDAAFAEVTQNAGLKNAVGQGAAGFTFLDYNNDGHMDIYLVNGLWSGHPEGEEVSPHFLASLALSNQSMVTAVKEDTMGFKDFLRQMEGTMSSTGKMTKSKGLFPTLAGYQHNRLMRNNGDGTFTDVAFLEGVDALVDGYVVGNLINKDGTQDLVLRNGDPGTASSTKFPVVQYFRNTSKATDKVIQLTLEGQRSNRDAIGAFVIATFKDKTKQVQHLVANSGSLQNERKLRFVSNGKLPELTVHWPSGEIQSYKNVAPGKYHIKEADQKMLQSSL